MAPTPILVGTTSTLETCLEIISSEKTTTLAVDLEGVELCRHGRVSILQLLANNSDTIWLVDVTVLGELAFSYTDKEGRSLKGILESTSIRKIIYDVRNDADALWNIYGVELGNTYDLQVLEIASRRALYLRVKFVTGLGKAINTYLNPGAEWKRVKDAGVLLFAPEKGGSYEIFETRPLDPRIQAYSAQDVELLFQLEAVLESKLGRFSSEWKAMVVDISAQRVKEAHSATYSGHGDHRAIAPAFNII